MHIDSTVTPVFRWGADEFSRRNKEYGQYHREDDPRSYRPYRRFRRHSCTSAYYSRSFEDELDFIMRDGMQPGLREGSSLIFESLAAEAEEDRVGILAVILIFASSSLQTSLSRSNLLMGSCEWLQVCETKHALRVNYIVRRR
jgi:hypothetical protein